jgi:hypothetical protein
MISESEKLRFEIICREEMLAPRRAGEGIGTLSEKRLHSIIKKYIAPEGDDHEVELRSRLSGEEKRPKYVADLLIGNTAYEVQTGSFYPMRKKIDYYMSDTDYNVVIIHPVAYKKHVNWMDPATGEVIKRTRKTVPGRPTDIAGELYWILPHIDNPRLSIRVMMLAVEEYRFASPRGAGVRRGSERYELIPTELCDIVSLELAEDYSIFIPDTLATEFTVGEYEKLSKIRGKAAYGTVKALCALGLVREIGKRGRAVLYQRCDA